MSLWSRAALWIAAHGGPILLVIVAVTIVLGAAMLRLETDHTAGSFVAEEEEFVQEFREAGKVFGRSETILYVVFDEVSPFDPDFLVQLDSLTRRVSTLRGVDNVLSLTNVPHLERKGGELEAGPIYNPALDSTELRRTFERQPFLQGLLLSKRGAATMMMVRIDPVFNATPERIDLVDRIESLAQDLPGEASLAGFPYLRTQYAKRVSREAPMFTLLSLLISLALLFVMFRSWRAVVLPTFIVALDIIWTFGLMSVFGQKLNIVNAVLPALLVIIGMETAIHLSTKFFDEFQTLGDRKKAIAETVRTVGLATFLSCLTTAIGFAVLVLSGNDLLVGFGIFSAAGIMILFALAITIMPIAMVHLPAPRVGRSALATNDRFADFFEAKARLIRKHSGPAVLACLLIAVVGVIGVTRISTEIFVFSDFYPNDPLREQLATFEKYFGGVLPMEVVIESDRNGRFRTLSSMRRIEQLQERLSEFDEVGTTLSAVDLVKMGNQAYFGGHPGAYRLPSSYELPFLEEALGRFIGQDEESSFRDRLPLFVDSTFSITRIYLGVSDIGTNHMNALADSVEAIARRAFAGEEFDVVVTGTAIMSTRSGESLVNNLIGSLAVALVLISILMALLFRSRSLTFISLAPNVLPLLVVGAAMGFAGITLKPSTALIFSLAFGIAVDNSIHFLAKYRIFRDAGLPRNEAILRTLRETGKAIFFTSLVLIAGFLIFTRSSFGGTATMGALTALTLAVASLSNLFLLPALLFRYGPTTHFKTEGAAGLPAEVSQP